MRQVNGYTIIASTFDMRSNDYLIIGVLEQKSLRAWGDFSYVTARMRDPKTDTEWYWGNYHNTIQDAVRCYDNRLLDRTG